MGSIEPTVSSERQSQQSQSTGHPKRQPSLVHCLVRTVQFLCKYSILFLESLRKNNLLNHSDVLPIPSSDPQKPHPTPTHVLPAFKFF